MGILEDLVMGVVGIVLSLVSSPWWLVAPAIVAVKWGYYAARYLFRPITPTP